MMQSMVFHIQPVQLLVFMLCWWLCPDASKSEDFWMPLPAGTPEHAASDTGPSTLTPLPGRSGAVSTSI